MKHILSSKNIIHCRLNSKEALKKSNMKNHEQCIKDELLHKIFKNQKSVVYLVFMWS